jgi:hypothetical protein
VSTQKARKTKAGASLRPLSALSPSSPAPLPHFLSQCSSCRACLGFSRLAVARAPVRSVIVCGQANGKTPSVACLGAVFQCVGPVLEKNTAAPLFSLEFPVICLDFLTFFDQNQKNRNIDQNKQFFNGFCFCFGRTGGLAAALFFFKYYSISLRPHTPSPHPSRQLCTFEQFACCKTHGVQEQGADGAGRLGRSAHPSTSICVVSSCVSFFSFLPNFARGGGGGVVKKNGPILFLRYNIAPLFAHLTIFLTSHFSTSRFSP